MANIFISHAVADKDLADKFVAFLKEAIGVPSAEIFCSSVEGHGIPLGLDFNDYMKQQIQNPKLVILLMTPRYMESWFCLMELGAAWANSSDRLPIVIPPTDFSAISSTLGLKQGWNITDHVRLIDVREKIKATGVPLEKRSEHDWEKKRASWRADLPRLLKKLAKATSVTAAAHDVVKTELETLKRQYGNLEEEYQSASELVETLTKEPDPAERRKLVQQQTGIDPTKRFEELIKAVGDSRKNVSLDFFRTCILMDRYRKAPSYRSLSSDLKEDMMAAVQYNLAEIDPPHELRWNDAKLKRVSLAVKDVEDFLGSPEGIALTEENEKKGIPMEMDDLDFWETHLWR